MVLIDISTVAADARWCAQNTSNGDVTFEVVDDFQSSAPSKSSTTSDVFCAPYLTCWEM
jgi:hypothetical protein